MKNLKKISLTFFILSFILINIEAITKTDIKIGKEIIEEYLEIYDDIGLKGEEIELPTTLKNDIKSYTQKKLYIIRKRMDNFNLNVDNYKHSYEYSKEEIDKDSLIIEVKLTKEYKFRNLKEKTFEIINYKFTLIKLDGKYIISEITSDDIYDVSIKELNLTRSEKSNIDNFLEKEEELIKKEKEELKDIFEEESNSNLNENNNKFNRSNQNRNLKSLNRNKMKDYAGKHYDTPNPNYYDFTNIGGDCSNFTSQVIRAGGAPFDNVGNERWYYYSLNNRTPSWTSVEYLYKYLINNTGFGLEAIKSDIFNMEIGDVIQIDTNYDGTFNHSVIVVENDIDKVKDNFDLNNPQELEDSKKIQEFLDSYIIRGPFLLVAARTYNSYNRPLLTYPGEKRYIHLVGYNQ